MGRQRIKIEYIANGANRKTTFEKRRVGIIKKAIELSVLCGADIGVVMFSDRGECYQYSSSPFEGILSRFHSLEGTYRHISNVHYPELSITSRASSYHVYDSVTKKSNSLLPAQQSPNKRRLGQIEIFPQLPTVTKSPGQAFLMPPPPPLPRALLPFAANHPGLNKDTLAMASAMGLGTLMKNHADLFGKIHPPHPQRMQTDPAPTAKRKREPGTQANGGDPKKIMLSASAALESWGMLTGDSASSSAASSSPPSSAEFSSSPGASESTSLEMGFDEIFGNAEIDLFPLAALAGMGYKGSPSPPSVEVPNPQ